MSDVELGLLAPVAADRDATHLAVVPVIAATEMEPGTHCEVLPDGTAGLSDTPIGIVDPFLKANVRKGERFYLCLYPRTVTGLRHVYNHPRLDALASDASSKKVTSERWLREFCATADCPGYELTIGMAIAHGENSTGYDDDRLHFNDMDAHGEIPAEFWAHLEVVSGKKLGRRATYFSCAC